MSRWEPGSRNVHIELLWEFQGNKWYEEFIHYSKKHLLSICCVQDAAPEAGNRIIKKASLIIPWEKQTLNN